MSRAILCIFARAPVAGGVKTRLAAEMGDEAALTIHRELVEDTLARLARVPRVETELWLDRAGDPAARTWAERWGLPTRQQEGDDLGERMHRALCHCLEAGKPGLVVGADCPGIDAAYVRRAVDAVDDHDVVLGPAADGGYGLVGARRPVPAIFRGIRWGTGAVLEETLEAARRAGITVALLEEIRDIDTAADWRRFSMERSSARSD